jgi:hypothetical protein
MKNIPVLQNAGQKFPRYLAAYSEYFAVFPNYYLFIHSTTPHGPLTMLCGTQVGKHCNRPTTSIIVFRKIREGKRERIGKEAGIPKERLRKLIETSDTSQ